jgi:hypothetical protein
MSSVANFNDRTKRSTSILDKRSSVNASIQHASIQHTSIHQSIHEIDGQFLFIFDLVFLCYC